VENGPGDASLIIAALFSTPMDATHAGLCSLVPCSKTTVLRNWCTVICYFTQWGLPLLSLCKHM